MFTAQNWILSRRTLNLSQRTFRLAERGQQQTFELAERGQVTDRFTKATEQLGHQKRDVRIGGIYALERIARDSEDDHPTVMEVLTAFIREHSREKLPKPDTDSPKQPDADSPKPEGSPQPDVHAASPEPLRPDVRAALTVIRRRDAKRDIPGQPIDLAEAVIRRADLTGAYLTNVYLTYATRTNAGALGWTIATRADLHGAVLTDTTLTRAHLDGADLTAADLTRADLTDANLTRANLTRANLTRANLSGADFTGAMHLRSANPTGVRWPEGVQVPDGWIVDDGDPGRLKRAPPEP